MTAYLSSGFGPSAAPAGQAANRTANARIAREFVLEGIAQTKQTYRSCTKSYRNPIAMVGRKKLICFT
jgi:hypothetical protein